MSNLLISAFMDLFECIDMIEDRIIWVINNDFSRQIYLSPSYEKHFEQEIVQQYTDPASVFSRLAHQDFRLLMDRIQNRNKIISDPYYRDKINYRVKRRAGIHWMEDIAFRIVDEFGKCIFHAGIISPLDRGNRQQSENQSLVAQQLAARDNFLELLTQEMTKESTLNTCVNLSKINQVKICSSMITLTTRESEVLELMILGKSSKQIAVALNISTKTVEFHINNLKNKTGSRTKFELLGKLIRCNVVTP